MYSRKVITAKLEKSAQVLGFFPEYHTVSNVQEANQHFEKLWDPEKGGWSRPLKQREIKWIRNERVLCGCDFRYWATRYAYIKDWKNEIRLFEPNIAQLIFLDVCSEMEESMRAIMLQALKARQLGISTITELCMAHRVPRIYGANGVVGSSDPDKSWKMSQMMERAWEFCPLWLMPGITKFKTGTLYEFGGMKSGLTIQHGTQTSGIARGDTVTNVHLSELCDYSDPEELVDASLLRALHDSPAVFAVFESTAAGRHNWWHNTWEYNKAHYREGKARMFPMFLPWFVGTDLYPTETWLRAHPVPLDWKPSAMTINHAERARNYTRSNSLLRKYLGPNWDMPRKQMWFWEVTREEYAAKKNLAKFYQEMPADDNECFQSTNISVFDADLISEYREATKKNPLGVYGVISDDIPQRLHPDRRDIDFEQDAIRVRYVAQMGIVKEFTLMPLKFDGYANSDPSGKLFIWEWPEEGTEYGIGVDTGEGVGLDQSVIEVLRKGTFTRNDAQVAEFSSPYVNAHDLWPIALAVGSMYSTFSGGEDGELMRPKMIIECMANGEVVQHELRKLGWPNFHQWVRYDSRKINKGKAQKMGWVQTTWARSMMIDTMIKYLRDGWCDIFSPWFVNEMQDFERDEERAYARAMYGGHDDRMIAFGICLFSLHDMEIRGSRQTLGQARQEAETQENKYPVWRGNDQDRDTDYDSSSMVMYQPGED